MPYPEQPYQGSIFKPTWGGAVSDSAGNLMNQLGQAFLIHAVQTKQARDAEIARTHSEIMKAIVGGTRGVEQYGPGNEESYVPGTQMTDPLTGHNTAAIETPSAQFDQMKLDLMKGAGGDLSKMDPAKAAIAGITLPQYVPASTVKATYDYAKTLGIDLGEPPTTPMRQHEFQPIHDLISQKIAAKNAEASLGESQRYHDILQQGREQAAADRTAAESLKKEKFITDTTEKFSKDIEGQEAKAKNAVLGTAMAGVTPTDSMSLKDRLALELRMQPVIRQREAEYSRIVPGKEGSWSSDRLNSLVAIAPPIKTASGEHDLGELIDAELAKGTKPLDAYSMALHLLARQAQMYPDVYNKPRK